MPGQLQDKVAIVTGGGTGIGEAICRKFAREGAKVVVNGLPDDPISDVVTAILDEGGVAIPFAGDVSDEAQAKACVDAAIEAYGRLDVLINNAGMLLVGAQTDQMPIDKFDEHIRCNIRTAFLMTKYALPYLRKTRGNIICRGVRRWRQWRARCDGLRRNEGLSARVHGRSRGRAGALRGACELRVPRADRYGVDAQGNRRRRREDREGARHLRSAWPSRHSRRSGQRLRVSRVGRRELRHRCALGGRRRADAIERSAGAEAGRAASTPPRPTIALQHSHDGTRHKEIVKLP